MPFDFYYCSLLLQEKSILNKFCFLVQTEKLFSFPNELLVIILGPIINFKNCSSDVLSVDAQPLANSTRKRIFCRVNVSQPMAFGGTHSSSHGFGTRP